MSLIDRKLVGCVNVSFFADIYSTSVKHQKIDHSIVQDVIVQNQEMFTTCGGHSQGPMSPAVIESMADEMRKNHETAQPHCNNLKID